MTNSNLDFARAVELGGELSLTPPPENLNEMGENFIKSIEIINKELKENKNADKSAEC